MSVVETATFEAETRHRSEIEATKIVAVDEQKDKILKLGRKLVFDGYNFCLKKMAKAFPEIDTEATPDLVTLPLDLGSIMNDGDFWTVELAGVSVGLEPTMAAIGPERAVRVADFEPAVAIGLVMVVFEPEPTTVAGLVVAVVEFMRLKLADFKLNLP
ncbi:hypothetical protein F0562_032325 [Nyssa sinensis]|uniref:Uncharacterized protein n=1 Tax=Nyssa sinensis TaxID=561372 RepID=A0A5J5ARD0_9ASTE|nr:hypothetical protein F0562_032325 [Nyssa sinensis]